MSSSNIFFLSDSIKYYSCYGAKWPIHYPYIRLNRGCRRRLIILLWFNDQSGQNLQRRIVFTSKSAITPNIVIRLAYISELVYRKSVRIPSNDLRDVSNFNSQSFKTHGWLVNRKGNSIKVSRVGPKKP